MRHVPCAAQPDAASGGPGVELPQDIVAGRAARGVGGARRRPKRPVDSYWIMLLSEAAEKLLAALRAEPGRMLCPRCVAMETGCNIYEVRKAIRELILTLKCQAWPVRCSLCDFATPVVTLWQSRRNTTSEPNA